MSETKYDVVKFGRLVEDEDGKKHYEGMEIVAEDVTKEEILRTDGTWRPLPPLRGRYPKGDK